MQIKSILAAAAIAIAAAVGSASAADQFTALGSVSADVMTPQEMGVVVGTAATLSVTITGAGPSSQAPVTEALDLTAATDGLTASAIDPGVIPAAEAAAAFTL